jgi:hypothetical protein
MKKVFEHRGVAASIEVKHNYEVERRINGIIKHHITLSCPSVNYSWKLLVPDEELVQSVVDFEQHLKTLIDNFLDAKEKDLDPRLTALGFK